MRLLVTKKFYWKMRVLEIKLVNRFHFHSSDYKKWYQLFPYWFITNRLTTFGHIKYNFSKWLNEKYIKDKIESHHFREFGIKNINNKTNDKFKPTRDK